ncbi:MAG: hypothetical protein ACD_12C00276G0002 [uncultured bacterium]|nr:MAG: hypothetical protein ACD_12C00276G0002 [uncultured bacterium]
MPWQVDFFQNNRGDYPVKDFIEKLDQNLYMKVFRYIDLISNYGPHLKPPFVKKIYDQIWELRITGKTQVRVLYIYFNNAFYLLHAFVKKTQKTPSSEIKVAIDRANKIL